jgi:hypothetical protein
MVSAGTASKALNGERITIPSMVRPMQGRRIIPTVMIFLVWSGCSSIPDVASHPAQKNITVDGNDDDWPSGLTPIDDLRSSVGFQNNGDHLFVCLRTVDRAVEMQILRGGLTVWLDSTGGKQKTFGIRFPLELTGVAGGDGDPEERLERFLSQPMLECELLGADKTDRQRVPLSASSGINAHLGFHHGVLVYELMVPLVRGHGDDHALLWNTKVGVGFETEAPTRPAFQRSPEREPGGEGGQGEGTPGERGGRGRGRRGFGGGRGNGERPEPVSGWVTATLTPGE